MNKSFHTLAPIIALEFMPKEFKTYLYSEGFTEDNLKIDADLPDELDRDNIAQNAEIHHAHSFKMEEAKDADGKTYLKWLDGDVLETLKIESAVCVDFHKEKVNTMSRYFLAKLTHYKVDSLTFPHLNRGKPWSLYHEKFETEMGRFIVENEDKLLKQKIVPKEMKDVYFDSSVATKEMWYKAIPILEKYENKEKLTDKDKMEICTICIQGITDLWITLWKELQK